MFHLSEFLANCPDVPLANQCYVACNEEAKACRKGCYADQCEFDCNWSENQCTTGCPCFPGCPRGCQDCPTLPVCQCEVPEENLDNIDCQDEAADVYILCIMKCAPNDIDCVNACMREYNALVADCPCMANCPDGCPCPSYTCIDRTTTTMATTTTGTKEKDTVLVLNTFSSQNHPLLMDSTGREDYDFNFTYEADTSAYMSCSLTYHGQMLVFGGSEGYGDRKQISQINGCALERIGTLGFNLEKGACTVADDKIYLCFDYVDGHQCYWSEDPTGYYHKINRSFYDHVYTRIASSPDELLAVGSDYDHMHAEVLDLNRVEWRVIEDYPFSTTEDFCRAPMVYHEAFYIFGGTYRNMNTIGKLDPVRKKWSKVGSLKTGRNGHAVTFDGQDFLVIGGGGELDTEKCRFKFDEIICEAQAPKLKSFYLYPELFMVENDFCK